MTPLHRPNENKISDGGRERASLGVEGWKSSQMWSVPRSAVRSIAWLDAFRLDIGMRKRRSKVNKDCQREQGERNQLSEIEHRGDSDS
jgi:hypothetical protein